MYIWNIFILFFWNIFILNHVVFEMHFSKHFGTVCAWVRFGWLMCGVGMWLSPRITHTQQKGLGQRASSTTANSKLQICQTQFSGLNLNRYYASSRICSISLSDNCVEYRLLVGRKHNNTTTKILCVGITTFICVGPPATNL